MLCRFTPAYFRYTCEFLSIGMSDNPTISQQSCRVKYREFWAILFSAKKNLSYNELENEIQQQELKKS